MCSVGDGEADPPRFNLQATTGGIISRNGAKDAGTWLPHDC